MPELKLSTNLSGFAFEDEGLAAYLRGLLKEHGVEGNRLVGSLPPLSYHVVRLRAA